MITAFAVSVVKWLKLAKLGHYKVTESVTTIWWICRVNTLVDWKFILFFNRRKASFL